MAKFTFDLTDKVAIVTGATKGLGYAMTQTLADHGANMVMRQEQWQIAR